MLSRSLSLIALMLALVVGPNVARAENAALAGIVSSDKEGAMEGVVVSAKKNGGTITVSVVSDDKGRYSFPAARLAPGDYTLAIRAIGYELNGPNSAAVTAAGTTADIKLKPTKNITKQMNNAEWLASWPGTDNQKKATLNCISCHNYDRIVRSSYDADQFLQIFDRMSGYYPGSTPEHPQRLVGNARRLLAQGPAMKATAEYLASINLSKTDTWEYPMKTLPRPKGRATHVIITEYDLPRKEIQPHDVLLDEQGTVWFSHFGEQFLGKLDPKTGKVSEFPIPMLRPEQPVGTLDLRTDNDGNVWVGMMYQAGIAKFDKKAETFKVYPLPDNLMKEDATQSGHLDPSAANVDGKVWVKNSSGSQILRLDLKTGQWENLGDFKDASGKKFGIYGIHSDRANNLYLLDFQSSNIGLIDAKTKDFKVYHGPIANSRPRRGAVDEQNRLWYAEYGGNAVGLVDPKTAEVKEWVLPTAWAQPYDVVADKNGEAWTGSMMSDRVSRLDPKTGEWVEYLMPKTTNIRRTFVDNRTNPVTFWVGSNHGASIIKVEPQD